MGRRGGPMRDETAAAEIKSESMKCNWKSVSMLKKRGHLYAGEVAQICDFKTEIKHRS
jgi:hypothetical protein